MQNLCNSTLYVDIDQVHLLFTSQRNMRCQFNIHTTRSKQLMLFFNEMCIEQTRDCQSIFLEIDDGRSRDDPFITGEPSRGKTNSLHMRKIKAQTSLAVTEKLISAFVFTTWIVQFLYFLNPKFSVSSHLQCLYSSVCVRPGQKPYCCFFPRGGLGISFTVLLGFCSDCYLTLACLCEVKQFSRIYIWLSNVVLHRGYLNFSVECMAFISREK